MKKRSVKHMLNKSNNFKQKKLIPTKAVNWGYASVKWAQFCGVLQLDNLTIEILPKIAGKQTSNTESCREALISMLQASGYLKLYRSTSAKINFQRDIILDVFIFDFCDQLNIQLSKGLNREYISREDNLNVLRGRLKIEEQFRLNSLHKERLFCRYDELHEDTRINRIFKFTLRLLSRLAHSSKAKKSIYDLLTRFHVVSDEKFWVESKYPVLNRTNDRFENLLEQCRLFIRGDKPDVIAGEGKSFALMFDMNELFECWVAAKLRENAKNKGIRVRRHKPQKKFGKWLGSEQNSEVFHLIPDICIFSAEKPDIPFCIADAKWKILDEKEKKMNIAQSDLYQMQAYANCYQVKSLMLFYPKHKEFENKRTLEILGEHKSKLEIRPVEITPKSKLDVNWECLIPL